MIEWFGILVVECGLEPDFVLYELSIKGRDSIIEAFNNKLERERDYHLDSIYYSLIAPQYDTSRIIQDLGRQINRR